MDIHCIKQRKRFSASPRSTITKVRFGEAPGTYAVTTALPFKCGKGDTFKS